MAGLGKFMHYISVLIITAELRLRVYAACNTPAPLRGTHHNGSLAVYQSGDVLSFSCDSGYSASYNPPTTICLDNGSWNPPDISCELNVISLVIAIVVALVAFAIFVTIVVCMVRRKRSQRNALSPKVIRRSPQFPEYPPETFEMSRPGSLYDSVRINISNSDKTLDPTHQRGNDYALTGVSGSTDQADDATDRLENPGQVDNEGIDIINAGGLKMTGALTTGSSQSHDYENIEIKRKEAGAKTHSYENTALPNIKKQFH